MLLLWHRAHHTFPGLADFTLPADPAERDRYIRATLIGVRTRLERAVSAEIAEWLRSEGDERARQRRRLRWILPQLREARELNSEMMRQRAAAGLVPVVMAAE